MSIISLLLVLALCGFCVWLITLIPMPSPFKQAIIGIAILILILFVLQWFGLAGDLPRLHL